MSNKKVLGSMKLFAICVDNVLDIGLARFNLKYQSVMTHVCFSPSRIFGSFHSLSVAMKLRSLYARKSCRVCLWR